MFLQTQERMIHLWRKHFQHHRHTLEVQHVSWTWSKGKVEADHTHTHCRFQRTPPTRQTGCYLLLLGCLPTLKRRRIWRRRTKAKEWNRYWYQAWWLVTLMTFLSLARESSHWDNLKLKQVFKCKSISVWRMSEGYRFDRRTKRRMRERWQNRTRTLNRHWLWGDHTPGWEQRNMHVMALHAESIMGVMFHSSNLKYFLNFLSKAWGNIWSRI